MFQHLMKHSALKLKDNCILDGEPQKHFASMPYPNGANLTHYKPYLAYRMYSIVHIYSLLSETETPTV